MVAQGADPAFLGPEAFAAQLQRELPRWAEAVKRSGAKEWGGEERAGPVVDTEGRGVEAMRRAPCGCTRANRIREKGPGPHRSFRPQQEPRKTKREEGGSEGYEHRHPASVTLPRVSVSLRRHERLA